MDIAAILMTIAGGGGLGSLLTIGLTRRKGEFELFQSQLQQMGKELEHERQRNRDLTQGRNEMRDYYEEVIADKQKRLREVQDREVEQNKTIIALTAENGELKAREEAYHCNHVTCPWGDPPKRTTLPKPEGMSKDEWHIARIKSKEAEQ